MVVIKCVLCAVEKEYNYKYCFKDMENRERPQVTKNCTGILIKKRTPNEKEISYCRYTTWVDPRSEQKKKSNFTGCIICRENNTRACALLSLSVCVCVRAHNPRVVCGICVTCCVARSMFHDGASASEYRGEVFRIWSP